MNINIKNNISFYIVKGEVEKRSPNLWIRAFLRYISERPLASPTEICRDLFGDNGKAREKAVKNILVFFQENGIIAKFKDKGYQLTNEGIKALNTGILWQGIKGAFLVTFWTPAYGYDPIVLNFLEVPDNWYNEGRNGFEEIPDNYGENFSNLTLCSNDIRNLKIGDRMRPTFFHAEFKADFDPRNGEIHIAGYTTNENKLMQKNVYDFEVAFKTNKSLRNAIYEEYCSSGYAA
ncbi:MAG: hypothetical protein HUK21_11375 [Fibrobacteraceae bacterium]|nr:hypothetical protein [Fibrobacteraceae bacterium]